VRRFSWPSAGVWCRRAKIPAWLRENAVLPLLTRRILASSISLESTVLPWSRVEAHEMQYWSRVAHCRHGHTDGPLDANTPKPFILRCRSAWQIVSQAHHFHHLSTTLGSSVISPLFALQSRSTKLSARTRFSPRDPRSQSKRVPFWCKSSQN